MLIPIGFLGAGGAAGAYELIETAYGTGSSGTITFSSIPSTYKHLQIRYTGRNTADDGQIRLTFNGVTSGYSAHRLFGNGSTVTSSANYGQSSSAINNAIAPSSSTANAVGSGVLEIMDYLGTKNKTVRALFGKHDGEINNISLSSALLVNTSAITSITLATSTGNFATISRFSLYGIKGA